MKQFLFYFLILNHLNLLASTEVIYIASGGSENGIYKADFHLNNGTIKNLRSISGLEKASFIVWHPSDSIFYAVGSQSKVEYVVGFKVEKNGSVQEFTRFRSPDGKSAHLAVNPSGTLLMTAQYRGGSVALYTLDVKGHLLTSSVLKHENPSRIHQSRQTKNHPHYCTFSKDGRYALVPDLGSDKIHVYKVNEKDLKIEAFGEIESLPGSGPRHMKFSKQGNKIYLLNELGMNICLYHFDLESGNAQLISVTETLRKEIQGKESFNSAAEILVHPNGRYLYSSNRGHDSISAFQLDLKTGSLTPIEVEPVRGAWPRNINISPDGNWILAANVHSSNLSVFKIDGQSGELTHTPRTSITIDKPMCISFQPK